MRHCERDAQRLEIVVAQHQACDVIGHLGEECVAARPVELAGPLGGGKRDLDVDLDVGRVHARRIVDRIGIAAAAEKRELDPPLLGDGEIGALSDDARLELGRIDPDRVIGAVAGIGLAFARSFHIGADAAEPQKVAGRFEKGMNELLRRDARPRKTGQGAHFRTERNGFEPPREHPAAAADQRPVIVLPARARQVEQPPAFGKG